MVRESQDHDISQVAKRGKRICANKILLENVYFCEFIKATALMLICLMLSLSKKTTPTMKFLRHIINTDMS
jgi:hypothetical protein